MTEHLIQTNNAMIPTELLLTVVTLNAKSRQPGIACLQALVGRAAVMDPKTTQMKPVMTQGMLTEMAVIPIARSKQVMCALILALAGTLVVMER